MFQIKMTKKAHENLNKAGVQCVHGSDFVIPAAGFTAGGALAMGAVVAGVSKAPAAAAICGAAAIAETAISAIATNVLLDVANWEYQEAVLNCALQRYQVLRIKHALENATNAGKAEFRMYVNGLTLAPGIKNDLVKAYDRVVLRAAFAR